MDQNNIMDKQFEIKQEIVDDEELINPSEDINKPQFHLVDIKHENFYDFKSETTISETLIEVVKPEELIEVEEVILKDDWEIASTDEFLNNKAISDTIGNLYEPSIDLKEIKQEFSVNDITEFDDNNIEIKSEPSMKIDSGEEKPFQCIFCNKRFFNKDNLMQHIGEITSCHLMYECPTCKKKFSGKKITEKHIKKCTKCEFCQQIFINIDRFNQHIHTHRPNNKKRSFKCEICHNTYRTQSQLTIHMQTHTHEVEYECNVCKMRFDQISLINEHMKCHMSGDKPLIECKICKRMFHTQFAVNAHMKCHMSEDEPLIECKICKRIFQTQSAVNAHMRCHSKDKPLICTDNKSYECEICNKIFKTQRSLTLHLIIHKNTIYNCNLCTKKYSNKKSLTRHKKWHSVKKPYQCKICKISYASSSHKKVHAVKESPFE